MAQRRNEPSVHNRTDQQDEVRESSLQPIVWKGSREFRHDLFKLDIQEMKKNVSYKKYQPEIEKVEHVHFFHSVDMKGKPLKYSAAVGGHFHEITVEHNSDGSIRSASCGPALRSIQKKLRNGKVKTVIEKVKFATADLSEEEDGDVEAIRFLHDDHTHNVTYFHSEMISPDKLRQKQSADSQKLSQMIQADPNTVKGSQPAKTVVEEDGGDDAGIKEE